MSVARNAGLARGPGAGWQVGLQAQEAIRSLEHPGALSPRKLYHPLVSQASLPVWAKHPVRTCADTTDGLIQVFPCPWARLSVPAARADRTETDHPTF